MGTKSYTGSTGTAGTNGTGSSGAGTAGGTGGNEKYNYIGAAGQTAVETVLAGGAGGAGGSGSAPNGAAGAGGAGGYAKASAYSDQSTTSTLTTESYATGGSGGGAGAAQGSGHGASGGAGGYASASAKSKNGTSGAAEAIARATGGSGGSGTGSGYASGAGGTVAGSSAAAYGTTSAYARVIQTGGNGGRGYNGANGGAAGASTLTNAAKGSTSGGQLNLVQQAGGGNGGYSTGGTAAAGGAGSSSLTVNDSTSSNVTATSRGYGGNGGYGGAGSNGATGGAGSGSLGLKGTGTVSATQLVSGGTGGRSASGNGGAGGTATSAASYVSTTSATATASLSVRATGGSGGVSSSGAGKVGGAGGTATIGLITATGYSTTATVAQTGGAGGNGYSGASGGAGAASTLTNDIASHSSGGIERLHQGAYGGTGGYSRGGTAAGTGGNASSSLTFDDTTNAQRAANVDGYVRAGAGTGGGGGSFSGSNSAGAAGGSSTALINMTGAQYTYGIARSYGGAGGAGATTGGQGGSARGTSTATSTTTGSSSADAFLDLGGGTSGRSGAGNGLTGGAVTSGSATATEQHATAGRAYSRLTATGGAGGTATGAGTTGGAGGGLSNLSATAYGFNTRVVLSGTGGGGGHGYTGAGGAGASVTLSNAVSGTSRGGYIDLFQTATGGAGGTGATTAGAGGNGSSSLNFTDSGTTQSSYVRVYATSSGGVGGVGYAGNGGAGGTATSTSTASGSNGVISQSRATGGTGGSGRTSGTGGVGGGATIGSVTATSSGASSNAIAHAYATGGAGGRGYGAGKSGGAAGSVLLTNVSASGFNASALASQTGGAGGYGYTGASGAAGASSTLSNVVSGVTTGGTLLLEETATGGHGGDAYTGGTAGNAGAGSASLTLNDSANTTHATQITTRITATGGAGGGSSASAAAGAAATATQTVTGVRAIDARSFSTGGAGGNNNTSGNGGAGGAATASSLATSTTTGSDEIRGYAYDTGGTGGNAASGSGGAGGAASNGTGSAVGNSGTGGRAYGYVRQIGGAGGSGGGAGHSAGNGGTVSGASVDAVGDNARGVVRQTGGAGGYGTGGASGGAGASSTLTNAVTGSTSGGYWKGYEVATGGAGGRTATGTAGTAGNASASLTFNDLPNPAHASGVYNYTEASGGAGGTSQSGNATTGGTAYATTSSYGANTVRSRARANGGTGGYGRTAGNGGAGGSATLGKVLSSSSSTTAGVTSNAQAYAYAGAGGRGYGSGHSGGVGGADVLNGAISATGMQSYARVTARGGAGGSGYSGASGAAGASVTGTNLVGGSANGSLNLRQYLTGGAGGNSNQATGGNGGSATSALSFNDSTTNAGRATNLTLTSNASGGAGGGGATTPGTAGSATASAAATGSHAVAAHAGAVGGAGGANSSASGNGVAGGAASASATVNSSTINPDSVGAYSAAIGGAGGSSSTTSGSGGAGGNVTASTAAASAPSESGGRAYGYARATGGAGGRAFGSGSGQTAGAGGTVSGITASASGISARARVISLGGAGGRGYSGAAGGNGGTISLTNAVSEVTQGGYARLLQGAYGGTGGYGGGGGGAATSSLTFDDTGNAVAASSSNSYVVATGGNGGGSASIGGAGGAATASDSNKSLNSDYARATATGGSGGAGSTTAGAGGNAQATAVSTATGLGAGSSARAAANATGGPNGSGTAHANATASATATTANGQQALSSAIGGGGTDNATATANTLGDSVLRGLTTSAHAAGSGTMETSAQAIIDGSFDGFQTTGFSAYSYADGMPTSGEVAALVSGTTNVKAALGTATTALDFADGTQGAFVESGVSGTQTYTSSESFTIDSTSLSGTLVLGLIAPQATGSGLTSETLTVTVGGTQVVNQTETGLAAANGYFTDDAVSLGAVTASSSLAINVSLSETFTGSSTGYAIEYLIGATNGQGPPVINAPLSAHARQSVPLAISGLSLTESGATGSEQFTVTVSDTNGLLGVTKSGSAGITNNNSTSVLISGDLADVSGTLASLHVTDGTTPADTIQLSANDQNGQHAVQQSIALSVSAALGITAPATASVAQSKATAISGVSLTETATYSGETFVATLTDSSGLLSATAEGAAGVSGAGSKSLSISGSLSAVDATLATLTDNDASSDTIVINASDSLSGSGGTAGPTDIAVSVSGSPVITAPAAATIGVGQPSAVKTVSVSETGAQVGEQFTVTLADSAGALAATAQGSAIVSGGGTNTLQIKGSLSDVNSTLSTLTDNDLSTNPDTINVNASDSLGGTAAQQQIAMTVNGKPQLFLDGPQTITANKAAAVNVGSVAESGNTTGETFTVTLSDSHGLIDVTNAMGAGVSNNDSTSVTISGSVTQVDNALGNVTDDNATIGSDQISVGASDSFGNSAPTGNVPITVINGPTISAPTTLTIGVNHSASVPGVSISETGATGSETFTVVLNDTNGKLNASTSGSDTVTPANGNTQLTIAGDLTDVNASLATLADLDASANSDTITISASDSLGGNAQPKNIAVIVNNVPVLNVPASATTGVGQSNPVTGLSVSESGSPGSPETFTVTVADTAGVLAASISGTDTVNSSNGGKTLTISGAIGDVNVSLGGLHDKEPTAGTSVDTLTLNATDSFGNSAVQQTVPVTVNGAPAITAPTSANVTLATSTAINGVSVTESGNITNGGAPQVTVTLSDTHGSLSVSDFGGTITGNNSTSLSITSSFGVVNSDLASLSDTDSTSGADSIKLNATDGFGNTATQQTIAVTAAGSAPVITAPAAVTIGVNQGATLAGFSIAESGATGSETFTATLSDTNGVLTATGGTQSNGGHTLTVSGTLSAVNTDLATLKDTDGTAGGDTISSNANDSFGGTATAQSTAVTINGVPVITAPASENVALGAATAISGVSVTESGNIGGAGAPNVTVTLADTHGALSVSTTGGTVTGNGSGSLSISGNFATVNSDLASLSDTDSTSGADSIKLNATDGFGNTATQQTIAVTAGNAPVITAPAAVTIGVNQGATLAGFSIAESGATGSETFTATLSDTNGVLTATGGTQSNGGHTLTVSGTLSAVNTDLATLKDTDGTAGGDTISSNANDSFGGTATAQSTAVTINGVPVITAPASENVALGAATAISGVSVTESGNIGGAGAPNVTVTLADTHGALSVSTTGGTVTGNGSGSLSISGNFATVNSDLASLSDTDSTSGADSIKLNATDGFGNTATQQTIAVTAGNAPVITAPAAVTIGVNQGATLAGFSIAESGATGSETFTATLSDTNGVLTATGGTQSNGGHTLTVSGTLSAVNTDLATLKDTDGTAGGDTISSNANDSFGGTATAQSTAVTINGVPVITAPASENVALGAATAISGVSVTESGNIGGAGAPNVTVTLADTHGALSVSTTGGTVTGNGSGSLSISGNFATVNSDLASLSDTDSTSGADSIKLNATDGFGNTATQQTIAVTAGNAPVITAPAAVTIGVNQGATLAGFSIAESGATGSETFTATLSDTNGVLTATGGTQSNGGHTLTVSGTLSAVNTDLATLKDTDGTAGGDTISSNANDSFGGTATAQSTAVTINGVPVITAPASENVALGAATAISGVSVTESGNIGGAGAPNVTVTLADTHGALSVSTTGGTVTGNGSGSLSISGNFATVNSDLASLSDTDSTSGADSIKLNATDGFGNTATQQTIAVTAGNAPVITAPAAVTIGVNQGATLAGFSIAESGATGSETFTATLSDTNGVLTATGGTQSNGGHTLTVSGTLSAVNTDLATLKDTDGTAGGDTISSNANDSFGGTATAQSTAVTINGVPVITAPAGTTVVQANSSAISGVSISESGNTTGETFTVTLSDTNGLLNAGGGVQSNSDHTLTISGSLANVNSDLGTLTDTDSNAASDSIGVNASDSLGNNAAPKSIAVTVTTLVPVLTAPSTATVQQSSATAISGVSLAETNNTSGEIFTATLSDTDGALSVTANGSTVGGNDSKSVTISGSLTQVDAALASLTDDDTSAAADSISVNASDSFGNQAAAKSIAVTVTPSSVIGWAEPVSGSWNIAGNWNPATVPGASNQADINVVGTGPYTVTSSQSNTVGTLSIGNASAILALSNSSTFTVDDLSASLNSGTIQIGDGSTLDLDAGTFTNSGSIALGSVSHATDLGISGHVTLNGGGNITLANLSTILGVASGAVLTNANNTLSGTGTIGNAQLTLANGGNVEALAGNTLTLNTGSNTITNTGTLTSSGGDLVVASAVGGTGTEQISAGGTMEFRSSVSGGQTVTFSNIGDTLKLDAAQTFSGTLAGLATASASSFDAVDLSNFKFAYTTITQVTGTGAKNSTTNVTLTDSVDHLTTTLHLLNQAAGQFGSSASDYSLTSDQQWLAGTVFSVAATPGKNNTGIGH